MQTTLVTSRHGHLLDSSNERQNVVGLSSGESEFYTIGYAAAGSIMVWHILEYVFGITGSFEPKCPVCYSDSSAGRGVCKRRGVGKIKHMEVKHLWVQELVAEGKLQMATIDTTLNTADLGTKFLAAPELNSLLAMLTLTAIVGFEQGAVGPLTAALTMTPGDATCMQAVATQQTATIQDEKEVHRKYLGCLQ